MREYLDESRPPVAATSGTQAVLGALVAIVGVVAAVNPSNPLLRAIGNAAPQVAAAVPTVITACGAIVAAFSQPPRFLRRRSL